MPVTEQKFDIVFRRCCASTNSPLAPKPLNSLVGRPDPFQCGGYHLFVVVCKIVVVFKMCDCLDQACLARHRFGETQPMLIDGRVVQAQ